jgi:opacity protein-like surface antigen
MRKTIFRIFTIALVAAGLAIPSSVLAEQGKFYFGPAMGYNMDAFNAQMDNDNAYGFNFVLGYDFTKNLTLEAQFDKINEIGTKNSVSHEDADLQAYSLNVKYYPAKTKEKINGYITFGLGWMEAEAAGECSDAFKKGSGTDDDLWGKFGVGSDFVVTDKISFFVEADYSQGFKDLNPLDFFSAKIGFKIYP